MRRMLGGTFVFATFLLVSGAAVTGQDNKKETRKGALPANYGKLGLSDEQKAKIHAISAEYKAKIDSLNGQVKDLQAKRKKETEAILTETQIELLRKLQTGESGDKKPEASKKPAENGDKKPDTKKPAEGDKKPTDK